MKRKIFAVLLSVMLVMCMMPAMAFAEGEAADEGDAPETTVEEVTEAADEASEEAVAAQDETAEGPTEEAVPEEIQEPEEADLEVQEPAVEAEEAAEEPAAEEPAAEEPAVEEPAAEEPVEEAAVPAQEETEEAAEAEEFFYPNTDFSVDQYIESKENDKADADGVLVLYKAGKVSTLALSKSDRAKADKVKTSGSFGSSMSAISLDGKTEAANTLLDQKKILDKALGSYTIKDTMVFKGDLDKVKGPVLSADTVVSLVSSDKYSPEKLAEILNEQDDILLAEPNYRCYALGAQGTGTGDPSAKYAWQTQVMNSQVVKEAIPADSTGEVVVAIIDTGVDYTHEELAETMWVNPGFKDLKGTYGYDFVYKDADPLDENGHGTHCAGIIAAQAMNDVGTLGIAGDVPNVKIMALRFLDEDGSGYLDDAIAAYCYIIRAIDDGVNVVAINDSWGGAAASGIFTKVIDMAGEKGALSFVASGNESLDNDCNLNSPSNEPSAYTVVVNSLNEKMELSSYTCYGRKTTDVASPGTNIISSVSYDNYMPYNYGRDQLEKTTAYYGEFDDTTVIDENGNVTPTVGTDVYGESNEGAVLPLGTSVMKSCLAPGSNGSMSLSLGEPSSFNFDGESRDTSTSRSLEWKITDPSEGDVYMLFFPYEKEAGVQILSSYLNVCFHTIDDPEAYPYPGIFLMGDVGYRNEDSNGNVTVDEMPFYLMDEEGYYMLGATDSSYDDIYLGSQVYARCSEYTESHFVDKDGVTHAGIGIMIKIANPGDVTFCIDSLGVAKKDADPETFGRYDLYSGTSMATPAACATGALLAAAYPEADALEIKSQILASTTLTDELSNTCTTGGYIDFTDFDITAPGPAILDASVNFKKGQVTLTGRNLGTEVGSITYERPHSGVEGTVDSKDIKWSKDKIVISNAKDLISADVTFIVTTASGKTSRSAFYTVKGEKLYDLTAKMSFFNWDWDIIEFGKIKASIKENLINNLPEVSASDVVTEYMGELLSYSQQALQPVIGADMPYFTDTSGNIYFLDETPVDEEEGGDDYLDGVGAKRPANLTKVTARDGADTLSDSEETTVPYNNLWAFDTIANLLKYTDNYNDWTKLENEAGYDTSGLNPVAVSNAVYCGGKIYEEIKMDISGRDIHALVAFDPMEYEYDQMLTVVYDSEKATSGITPDNVDSYATLAALNGKIYLIGGFNSEAEDMEDAMSVSTFVIDPYADSPCWEDTGAVMPNYIEDGIPGGFAGGTALTHNGKIYYVLGDDMTAFFINLALNDTLYPFNDYVYEFDGKEWNEMDTPLPYAIRVEYMRSASVGINAEGLTFAGLSTDGGGDTFVYKTGADVTDRIEKVNYTINGGLYEGFGLGTTVGTEQYFIAQDPDDMWGEEYEIYKLQLTSNGYGFVDLMQTGKGNGKVQGTGTYSLGETAPIVITPDKTSFIKSVYVDGKKITVKDPTKLVTKIKKVGEYHTVEVEFGTYKISKATIKVSSATYTGKVVKPKVTVKLNGKTLKAGTDYKVTCTSKKIGKGKVKITGKGKYTGTKTKTFSINPAKVKNLKVTGGKKALTVSFTKGKGSVKYQIAYRVKGSSKWKTVTSTTNKKTISGLKGGKTYQVKVRAFKKVSGKTYYGKWVIKTAKTSK